MIVVTIWEDIIRQNEWEKIFVINLVIIILTSTFLLESFEFGSFSSIIIAQIIIAILVALYSPNRLYRLSYIQLKSEVSALSVSYNTATSIFGGTAR